MYKITIEKYTAFESLTKMIGSVIAILLFWRHQSQMRGYYPMQRTIEMSNTILNNAHFLETTTPYHYLPDHTVDQFQKCMADSRVRFPFYFGVTTTRYAAPIAKYNYCSETTGLELIGDGHEHFETPESVCKP